jgi:hypothetical protein
MNPKGTILIDLDDTLMYTQKFKAMLFNAIREAGIPDDIAEKAMKEFRAQNHDHIDFKGYAQFLKDHYSLIIPEKTIEQVYSLPLEQYLKGNVVSAINELKNRGYELRLLSKGSPDFQMYKIQNSGLHPHFHPNIHICTDKKICIQDLALAGPVIFVNDRLKETKAIREQFPDFKYFHVNRDDAHTLYDQMEVDMESIDTIEDLLTKLN